MEEGGAGSSNDVERKMKQNSFQTNYKMLVDSVQPGDYYVSAVGVVGDFHFARHSHRMGAQVKRGRV